MAESKIPMEHIKGTLTIRDVMSSVGSYVTQTVNENETCIGIASDGSGDLAIAIASWRFSSDGMQVKALSTNTASFRASGDSFVCDSSYATRVKFIKFTP